MTWRLKSDGVQGERSRLKIHLGCPGQAWGRRGSGAAETDSWRLCPDVSLAAVLPVPDLSLLARLLVLVFQDFMRVAALGRHSAAFGEHGLIVGHLELLQFLVDLLQVRHS